MWNKVFDFTERDDGQKNHQLLQPKDFQIFGYRDVLKDVVLEEVGDADWLFELPIEYGGTLDQNAVATCDGNFPGPYWL